VNPPNFFFPFFLTLSVADTQNSLFVTRFPAILNCFSRDSQLFFPRFIERIAGFFIENRGLFY